jgi:hypothetical protein
MIGLVPINSAPSLNDSPPSFKKIVAFNPQWIIKKLIKKRPVMAIRSFFPSDELSDFANQAINKMI